MQPADTTSSAEIKNDPLDPIFDVDHDSGLRIGCYRGDFSSFCTSLQSGSPSRAPYLDCGLAEISIGALLTCELEGARCSWDKDSRAHTVVHFTVDDVMQWKPLK